MGIVTLLTDFGTRDEYVGVMKGVMFSIDPGLVVVDISHQIAPHDVVQAGHMLHAAYRYFPQGTVHVVVVDPGVGGQRAAVAFSAGGQLFLGPDNGVFSRILAEIEPVEIVRVEEGAFFLNPPSLTFHGRDIFAPVAARLAGGLALSRLGPPLDRRRLLVLSPSKPVVGDDGELNGRIVAVDHFGNLITDIAAADLAHCRDPEKGGSPVFLVAGQRIPGLSATYESGGASAPLAIIGSRGVLEIAVNRGSAREILKAAIGDPVRVIPAESGIGGHR